MKNKLRSLVAILLAVVLLSTAIPVFGMETTTVTEVEELREENVKHFEMTDGTYKAVVYSDAVHRKDADGVWQDIDNTLEAVKENGNTEYSSSDGRIKFSKNIKNGKIFDLSENGYKISLSLSNKNLKDSNADVKNHKAKGTVSIFDSEEEQLEKLKNVDNLTKVRYNNIEDGIDLEYEIYSNNLKESIIVNSKKDSYVYSFELKLNKLTAALNEDGSISLKDEETGEAKYIMPAPFMFDNAGELSTDVSYTLTQSGKYKYTLTVTADTEWINNEARELPVTIDPTIEVDNSYGEAYVSSTNPNTNYKKPSDGVLYLSSTQRIFLKFQLPTIPANNWITEAYLITQFYFSSSTGNMSIAAYQVPYSWNENTITWNNSVASHYSEENTATTLSTIDINPYMSATENMPMVLPFDVTSAVQRWCSGTANNNGIALKRTSGMTNAIAFKGIKSNTYLGPILEINYQSNVYYLRNVQSNTYVEKGTSSLNLQPFDGQTNQKWQITNLGNGYHKITLVGSNLALTAPTSTGGNISLGQYTGISSEMWSISQDTNGYYKISPKNSSTSFIRGSSSSVIVDANQPNNDDEWILYKVATSGINNFEEQEKTYWCWAACVYNFSRYFIESPPSQEAIVRAVFNNNDDQAADVPDVKAAIEFVFGEVNIDYNEYYDGYIETVEISRHRDISADDLEMLLTGDNPRPVIIFVEIFTVEERDKEGHAILAYDCVRDSQNELILSIYDPWYDLPNNYYTRSYSNLTNGAGDDIKLLVDYITIDIQ